MIEGDVSKKEDVDKMIIDIENTAGHPVDVLINNAGIADKPTSIDKLTEDMFDRTIAVNLKSAFLCTQRVLPQMLAKKYGRIVNISSGA